MTATPELKDGLYSVRGEAIDFLQKGLYENWTYPHGKRWKYWQGCKGVSPRIEEWVYEYEPSLALPIEYLT